MLAVLLNEVRTVQKKDTRRSTFQPRRAVTTGAQSWFVASSLTNLISGPPGRFARFSFSATADSNGSSSTVPLVLRTVRIFDAKSKTIASTFGLDVGSTSSALSRVV